ncbi:hypothetical protein BGX23_011474 [Mortierella sp. AD031]|nr:hypothetical protein BGX23_011474 [Mortierella sp. AD031]KAG0209117.1 hypothetical protein BGX33_005815 [Mortierella sp. NVP41]
MANYNSEQLSWNTAHTINRQGQYCYCGHDRRLDELSLQCKGCHNWFHASCIEVSLGPVVPFITNYKFLCKTCVVKPAGRNQQQQQQSQQELHKEPGSVPEFFERVTAGWKEICATTIANLIVQEYLKEARQHKGATGPSRDQPSEENLWSANAEYMDWKESRYYFNKKDHILPYVDRHWKALCTDRSRTTTWWATLGSCLYISKDVFEATDEQARSASSDFCLTKSNLWNMKPGHIASHQSSSSRSQLSKAQREGKRKATGTTGDDTGLKRSAGGKSEKKVKGAGGSSHNRAPATPPVTSQATYIPLPNTVVSTNNSGNIIAPFSTSNEHPYNRNRFKYVTCEPDPLLQYMLYRQTANPPLDGVRLCREDMSPYMLIDEECKTITTEKGFRMVRANCGVREGQWYYEATIDRGGEPRYEGRDGAHVRLGWARREATLQAPVGFDAYSYGIRDTTGEKVHMSRVTPFGEPFKTGDVIGLYISLPPDGNEKSFFKHRRLRRSFYFKGQLYFESVDYSPTKRYIEMTEYEATPIKTNIERPIPPPTIPGSKIIVYKNGVCQGVMWQDLSAILPIEQNAKEKDQLRFDDGTLGYYPVISVYRNGTATANFGPEFKYPPSKDPEAEAENRRITAEQNVWRPMSERWEEKLIEECLIDLVDEVELWVSEQAVLERSIEANASSSQAGRLSGQSRLQEYDQSEDDYRRSQDRSSESRMDRSRASEDRDLDDEDRDIDMDTAAEGEMTEDRMDDDDDDDDDNDDRRGSRRGRRQGHDHDHGLGHGHGHGDDDYSGDDRSQQDVEMRSRYDDDEYDASGRDDRRNSSLGHRRDDEASDDDRDY